MKKNGLNVKHFRYHITINYEFISMHWLIKSCIKKINKKCDQMMCSCDQLRKLVAQVRPVGRMSLEPCYIILYTTETALFIFFTHDAELCIWHNYN